MQDIQVDDNGDFRCAHCGSKHFTEKRTRRAKVIGVTTGVATVGLAGAAAPLVAKKKLDCQACGAYNKMGNAQPYVARATAAPATRTPSPTASRTPTPRLTTSTSRSSTQTDSANETLGLVVMAAFFGGVGIWCFSASHPIWGTILVLLAALCVAALVVNTDRPRHGKATPPPKHQPRVGEPQIPGYDPDPSPFQIKKKPHPGDTESAGDEVS